ncbi:3-oxoacyl-[acyl-carrier-protein] synthase III C-terminal domain-containing protein [Agaribacterium sp. ZY112]|uniref:3-oxoacyl-[acyl-carrier-protein] synthase III C-terminal domain-containing protein n=1 Tax=Agaribacterium sp. ZY112 TaxID=3233574 RepID=UPI003524F301
MNRLVNVRASAVYLPQQCVSSETLDRQQGLAIGSSLSKSGVAVRYYAGQETQSQMAKKAIDKALSDAGLELDDIDCLIAASGTMEQSIPCNAAKILAQYGANVSTCAFDINMTCLSALQALDLAASMIAAKQYKTILIVSSEVASVGLASDDVAVKALFGDGSAAFIVGACPTLDSLELEAPSLDLAKVESREVDTASTKSAQHSCRAKNKTPNIQIVNSHFRTYPAGVDLCEIRGGGSLYHPSKIEGDYRAYGVFSMQGKELYRQTASVIDQFLCELLSPVDLQLNHIDWVVPHQASGKGLKRLFKRLGIATDKVVNLLASRGNQISVSIPAALHELLRSYPVKPGHRILLIGSSAGLSLGAMVLVYEP